METGKVKFVNVEKGFGFITADSGQEYFFHYSALKNCSVNDLMKGHAVSFTPTTTAKGPRAEDITRVQ